MTTENSRSRASLKASAWLLLLLAASMPTTAAESPRHVSARSLLAISTQAIVAVQHAAAADARLTGTPSASPARVAPFWASLQGATQALAELRAGLGDPGVPPAGDLFSRVARAGGRLAELSAAWNRLGVPNAGVQAGLSTLSTSWTLFRGTYGPEGVRHRQDRPLTAEEAHRLEVVQRAQERLAAQILRLEERARRSRETEEARRLARFRARVEAPALAASDLDAYLAALATLPEIEGEWSALKAAAPKERRIAYARLDPIVEEIQTEAEIGSVQVLDLDRGKAWKFLDQTTAVPESLASAVLALEDPTADEATEGDEEGEFAEAITSEAESWCAEDDEECLAAEESAAAHEAAQTPIAEGAEQASPLKPESREVERAQAGIAAASTPAPTQAPAAKAPQFPGLCGDSSADGCTAAPDPAALSETAPSSSSSSAPPRGTFDPAKG